VIFNYGITNNIKGGLVMYKEFISKKEFNGTSGKLIEEIIIG